MAALLDASTGALVNKIQAVPNCKESLGLFADSAISGDVVFVNGVNCKLPANPAPAGEVIALKSERFGETVGVPAPRSNRFSSKRGGRRQWCGLLSYLRTYQHSLRA